MEMSIADIKNASNQSLKVDFNDVVDGLSTEGPISAELTFKAYNKFINVKGNVVANVKLVCDRCLNNFVEKIDVDVDETYALGNLDSAINGHSGQEIELKDGDFITMIDGDSVDVDDLIYQTVTLNIPNPCVCDINCNGDPAMEKYIKKEVADPRLEVFKNMNITKEGK